MKARALNKRVPIRYFERKDTQKGIGIRALIKGKMYFSHFSDNSWIKSDYGMYDINIFKELTEQEAKESYPKCFTPNGMRLG
jgi:hypothetical protein